MSISPPISACIVCRNEADRLGPCLDSLDWLDDVVVLDLGSDDGSAALAERCGARVVPHPPVPIVEQVRNTVAAEARHDWILVIDPDERVTPGLARALSELADDDAIDAVVLPRMNCDFGIEPVHPSQRYEPQLRMYRRSAVDWPMFPNRLPVVPEHRTRRLPAVDAMVLRHDRSRTIAEVLERSVRYAPAQAQAMLDEGITFTAAGMARALAKETRTKLVEGQAWRDGTGGLIRTGVLLSFKFHVWAELWRRTDATQHPDPTAHRVVSSVRMASETVRWTNRVLRHVAAHVRGVAARVRRAGRRLP